MLVRKAKFWLFLGIAILFAAPAARAQMYDPFIEPGHFDNDFQFFAPAEFDDFGGFPDPNTGWYFTYDRMYTNVSRSRGAHKAARENRCLAGLLVARQ